MFERGLSEQHKCKFNALSPLHDGGVSNLLSVAGRFKVNRRLFDCGYDIQDKRKKIK